MSRSHQATISRSANQDAHESPSTQRKSSRLDYQNKKSDICDGRLDRVPKGGASRLNDENAATNGSISGIRSKGVLGAGKKSVQSSQLQCSIKYSKPKQRMDDCDLLKSASFDEEISAPGIGDKKRSAAASNVELIVSAGKKRQQISSPARSLSTRTRERAPFVVPAKSLAVSCSEGGGAATGEKGQNDVSCLESLASVATKTSSDREDNSSDVSSIENVSKDLTPSTPVWSLDDFDVKDHVLGKGKFGRVHRAQEKQSKEIVALKVLSKSQLSSGSSQLLLLRREVEIQARLIHENILRLFGFFHDEKFVYLILEEATGGELYKVMARKPGSRFQEVEASVFVKQVATALLFLKSKHILHRDIKPENLLIGSDGKLKLSDFGWACHAPPPLSRRTTLCGTAEYCAPEMLIEKCYDHNIDNWALGVLMYELVVGKTPFWTKSCLKMDLDEKSKKRRINEMIWKKIKSFRDCNVQSVLFGDSLRELVVTVNFCDMVVKLLKRLPKDRIPLDKIIEHPWCCTK